MFLVQRTGTRSCKTCCAAAVWSSRFRPYLLCLPKLHFLIASAQTPASRQRNKSRFVVEVGAVRPARFGFGGDLHLPLAPRRQLTTEQHKQNVLNQPKSAIFVGPQRNKSREEKSDIGNFYRQLTLSLANNITLFI